MGAWGKEAQGLVSELGGRLATLTGDPRSLAFLRQRIGMAIQRGNAAAIRGTLHNMTLYNCHNMTLSMVLLHYACNRSLEGSAINWALLAKIARIGCAR